MLSLFINKENSKLFPRAGILMTTKYQKFGLRADKSLSDLPNPNEALTNILNGLSQTELFTPGDLKVINGLRNADVTVGDMAELNNQLFQYTPLASSAAEFVEPLVTIKDRIDNYKVVLGNPPFLSGGLGPTAKFFPSPTLVDQSTVSKTSNAEDLFDLSDPNVADSVVTGQEFWDNGVFRLDTKLYPDFTDPFGAIQWEGYADFSSLRFITSGLLLVEQDISDDGNWTIFKSIYDKEITFNVSVESYDSNTGLTTFTLSNWEDHKHLALYGVTSNKVDVGGQGFEIESFVFDEDAQTASFTVTGDATGQGGSTVVIEYTLGDDVELDTGTINLYRSYRGDKTRTRITWWFPDYDEGDLYQTKTLVANPLTASERLPYSFWYQNYVEGAVADVNSIEYFLDNRAQAKKNDSDSPLQVNNSLFMDYRPPEDFSDKVYKSTPFTFIHERFGKLVGDFSGVEEGDWLVFLASGQGLARKIVEIQGTDTVFVDDYDSGFPPASDTTTYNGTIFKHQGLIGAYFLSGNTISSIPGGQSIDFVRDDYLVTGVESNFNGTTTGSKFFRLANVDIQNGTVATCTFEPLYNSTAYPGSNWFGAVYNYTGLQDLSTVDQCAGTYGKEVLANASSGSTTVTLLDVNGISVGDYVQFVGSNGFINGSPNANGRTGFIQGAVQVASIASNTITLESYDPAFTGSVIVGEVPAASTLVFARPADVPTNWEQNPTDKELCVLPLNTAPPFEGTNTGLATRASFPNLRVNTLAAGEIDITLTDSNDIYEVTTETTYSKYLPVTFNGVTYKALIK